MRSDRNRMGSQPLREIPEQPFANTGKLLLTFLSFLCFVMVTIGVSPLQAQVNTADILGTVTDSTGASVSGAEVEVISLSTGDTRAVKSDDRGEYVVSAVPAGHYKIEIRASGFKTQVVSDLLAAAGDRVRIDALLSAGAVTESVEVQAAAPLLQTDSSTVGETLVEKSIQDLPLNGRNFVQLAQITAGANEGPPNGYGSGNAPDDRRETSTISVNGQSDTFNNYMIDGADNNQRFIGTIGIRPSVDAIAEIHVQTNNYSADAGRTAGGVINIITKSGGNELHGSLYEYFRNDIFDSTYFVVGGAPPGLPKSELRQNQFGGSVGGAIVKDKVFFFVDYEGFRKVQGQVETATVPTLYEEQHPGDFTDLEPGLNVSSSLSPIALNWFELFPAPTNSSEFSNYAGPGTKTQFSNIYDLRGDEIFGPKDRMFMRFSSNKVSTFTPGILPETTVDGLKIQPGGYLWAFAGSASDIAYNGQINYNHVFSNTLLLNLFTSYLRIDNNSYPLNYGTNASAAFGLQGANITPPFRNSSQSLSALTPMSIGVYATVGDGAFVPLTELDNTFQYGGNVIKTLGRHTIKTGAAFIHRQTYLFQDSYPVGNLYNYNGATQQENMANFLEGNVDLVLRGISFFPPYYRTGESSAYAQDDIRLTPHLTLNLGLRYDIFAPFTEAHNHISNFNPNTATMILAGTDPVHGITSAIAGATDRTCGVRATKSNVAPRFGFAQSFGHALVLRGGFGLTFFPTNYASAGDMKNQPFFYEYTGYSSTLAAGLPLPVFDPLGASTDLSGDILWSLARNFRSSYMEQYNLMLQKQIGGSVITAGYVGSMGRHMSVALEDINTPPPNASSNPQTLRPYYTQLPNVQTIGMMTAGGASSYSSLQITFQQRYSHGFATDINYTLAHGLDDFPSTTNGEGSNGTSTLPNDIHVDYGNSDLDVRHRFASSIIYMPPWGKSLQGLPAVLGKNWQVDLLGVYATGLPFTVLNVTDVSQTLPNDGVADRPNQIGKASLGRSARSINDWFNTAAFAVQTLGTLGTERRNQLYGPSFRHLDLSVIKEFPLMNDRAHLQFRAEGFNVTNTVALAQPNSTIGVPGFGAIPGTSLNYAPRQLQFALKLLF